MRTMYNESTSQLSRKCYEGLLVRSLLMKAYGFNSKSGWNISFINVSNLYKKDLSKEYCKHGNFRGPYIL